MKIRPAISDTLHPNLETQDRNQWYEYTVAEHSLTRDRMMAMQVLEIFLKGIQWIDDELVMELLTRVEDLTSLANVKGRDSGVDLQIFALEKSWVDWLAIVRVVDSSTWDEMQSPSHFSSAPYLNERQRKRFIYRVLINLPSHFTFV